MALLQSPVPRPNRVTSGYQADRGSRKHGGMDFAVPIGTPVFAMAPGKVISARDHAPDAAGLMVQVEHDLMGFKPVTRYMHLSAFHAKVGDQVGAGDMLALSGASGVKGAPHLHADALVDAGARPLLEGRFGVPDGGWVYHSDGRLKVPLEWLVPMDERGSATLAPKQPTGGLGWLILLVLLLWDN